MSLCYKEDNILCIDYTFVLTIALRVMLVVLCSCMTYGGFLFAVITNQNTNLSCTSKSKAWIDQSQGNVSHWTNMSTSITKVVTGQKQHQKSKIQWSNFKDLYTTFFT